MLLRQGLTVVYAGLELRLSLARAGSLGVYHHSQFGAQSTGTFFLIILNSVVTNSNVIMMLLMLGVEVSVPPAIENVPMG